MSDREMYCGDAMITVKRWLRPDAEITSGAMLPFMVCADDAQFVRDHEADPFVLQVGRQRWSLSIMSVEPTGKEGVWVSARVQAKISQRPTMPSPARGMRGTLMGAPVPGLEQLADDELPEGDAGSTAPLGLPAVPRPPED